MTFTEWMDDMEASEFDEIFKTLSPKDQCGLFINAREWTHAKRQRTSIDQNDNKLPDDIYEPQKTRLDNLDIY